MMKDPRPHKPGSPEPNEALDLLRTLARRRAGEAEPHGPPPAEAARPAEEAPHNFDALRELAQRLDRQLRTPPAQQLADSGRVSGAMSAEASRREQAPDARRSVPPRSSVAQLRREWAEFVDALPPARALVPRLSPALLAFVGIAILVLALAAVGPGRRQSAPANQAEVPPAQIVPPIERPAQQAPQSQQAQQTPGMISVDLAAVQKAMSECDAAAARETDSLYFLVLPLVQTNPSSPDWRAVALQTVGNAFLLLSAKDALDGLRGGKLALRPGRYTFSVLDSGTGATYSWNAATGMSRLSKKDSGTVKTLKLGLDFSAAQTGAQWSAEFKRDIGACYWVSVLVNE